jgi:putrescine aminotransferase
VNGITFIFDEVVTAYGRTGNWFAAEHFGVEPDIIVTAKGITSGYVPLGAVLVSDEIFEAATADGFPMGFTYCGHPTTCAVALANLEVIESDGLLERARDTGSYILERLRELEELPVVGEVRGVGMMHAVELVSDRETHAPLPMDAVPQDAIRNEAGVIVRECQHNIVLSPPLIMSREEADEVVDGMRLVIERLDRDGNLAPRG